MIKIYLKAIPENLKKDNIQTDEEEEYFRIEQTIESQEQRNKPVLSSIKKTKQNKNKSIHTYITVKTTDPRNYS